MKRHELEHVIRAASSIADDDEIVVIGSQAILGQFPDAPEELCVSNEADVYPRKNPERWELIDGSLGELSPFHDTFGYYAQGVEEGTATLPDGWQRRLIPIRNANTRGATGLCLEVHDLLVSKYVASRDKDRRFVIAAIARLPVERETLLERLQATPIDPVRRKTLTELVEHDFASVRGSST